MSCTYVLWIPFLFGQDHSIDDLNACKSSFAPGFLELLENKTIEFLIVD